MTPLWLSSCTHMCTKGHFKERLQQSKYRIKNRPPTAERVKCGLSTWWEWTVQMRLTDMMVNEGNRHKRAHRARPHTRKAQTWATPTDGAGSKVGREGGAARLCSPWQNHDGMRSMSWRTLLSILLFTEKSKLKLAIWMHISKLRGEIKI